MFLRIAAVSAVAALCACSANVDAPSTNQAKVERTAAIFAVPADRIDPALVEAGLDPARYHEEEAAAVAEKDPLKKADAISAFDLKYGAIVRATLDKPGIIDGVAEVKSDPGCLTSCGAGPSDTPRYPSSDPPPPWPETTADGNQFVSVNATFATGNNSWHRVRGSLSSTSLGGAEHLMTVNANIRLDRANAWLDGGGGFAAAGVELFLTVRDAAGTVFCTSPARRVAYTEGSFGHHQSDATPGSFTLSCSGFRARDSSPTLIPEVTLHAWADAGAFTTSGASAASFVTSFTSTRCVEPAILTDGDGLCIGPSGSSTLASGVSMRSEACASLGDQRWQLTTDGRIRSRAITSLCLQPFLWSPSDPATNGGLVIAATCDGSEKQRFVTLSGGRLQNQLPTSTGERLCLSTGASGGLGQLIQLRSCSTVTPTPDFQSWTFHSPI